MAHGNYAVSVIGWYSLYKCCKHRIHRMTGLKGLTVVGERVLKLLLAFGRKGSISGLCSS